MKKKYLYVTLAAIMFIGSVSIIFYYLWANGWFGPVKESTPTTTFAEFTYPSLTEPEITAYDPEAPQSTEVTEYQSPVNFEELQAVNPDIIGWIYMSNPEISLPVLRSPTDDSLYLYHDANGEYQREGSLFVEHQYNSDDFSDMCTIIYGHRMSDGSMFGTMQATFSESEIWDESQYVVIYTPELTHIYQIIATFPHDNSHILYYNDFTNESEYAQFVDGVFSMSGNDVHLVQDEKPEYGDQLLILSSCLWGDRTSRFLVMAKLIE